MSGSSERRGTGSGPGAWRALLLFELMPSFKGPLLWAAAAGLVLLVFPVRILSMGEFTVNGQPIGQEVRLPVALAIGQSLIVFLTTLVALCLCLDRTGAHFLRNNDLLVLSRPLGRPSFYLAKLVSVLAPALLYGLLAIALFWEELWRTSGINIYALFPFFLPMALGITCLAALYFLMRNFLGNFMIFFLWLLVLPVIYFANLWRYFAGSLREGAPQVPVLGLLPQFGGLHAHSLGMVNDYFAREDTWRAVANCGIWTVLALALGLWLFNRKRL